MVTGGMKLDPRDEAELKELLVAARNAFILLIILFSFIIILVSSYNGSR